MTAPAQSTSFPLHDLCTRALSDPTSITPSERNLIRGRPDPDTEHSLYIAKTSLPLSALVAKALTDPPTLSPDEAQVLVHGPVDRTHAEKAARFQAYDALTKEQRDLLDRASSAVADKDEQKAGNIAYLLLRDAKAKELGRPKETTTIYHTAASTAPRGTQPGTSIRDLVLPRSPLGAHPLDYTSPREELYLLGPPRPAHRLRRPRCLARLQNPPLRPRRTCACHCRSARYRQ